MPHAGICSRTDASPPAIACSCKQLYSKAFFHAIQPSSRWHRSAQVATLSARCNSQRPTLLHTMHCRPEAALCCRERAAPGSRCLSFRLSLNTSATALLRWGWRVGSPSRAAPALLVAMGWGRACSLALASAENGPSLGFSSTLRERSSLCASVFFNGSGSDHGYTQLIRHEL